MSWSIYVDFKSDLLELYKLTKARQKYTKGSYKRVWFELTTLEMPARASRKRLCMVAEFADSTFTSSNSDLKLALGTYERS